MIIIDLGRLDRMLNLIVFGRFQSPLIWNVGGVCTYLIGSMAYLYLPTIPDFDLMRDRLARQTSRVRHRIFSILAIGWRNTPERVRRLAKASRITTVSIIPIAISVHTVVAFVFAATLRPGWDSTILASNFVIGALFSGSAGEARRLLLLAHERRSRHGRDAWTTGWRATT